MGTEDLLIVLPKEIDAYIDEMTTGIKAPRNFVQDIKMRLNLKFGKCMLVTGMRSTGKTTGVLQALKGQNALYLSPVDKNRPVPAQKIIEAIEKNPADVIAVDEFSWIEQEEDELTTFLAGLTKLGRKVIITGTDTGRIALLKTGELIHRATEIHTTFFSYEEFLKIYNLENNPETMKRYLTSGGIFEVRSKSLFGSMENFIQTAVIDNLSEYCSGKYPKNFLKAYTYTIFYECICNLYGWDNRSLPVYKLMPSPVDYEDMLEDFGINPYQRIEDTVLSDISDMLEEIGVVVKIPDLRFPQRQRTLITNQSISAAMTKYIFGLKDLDDRYLGHLYEASVGCHLYHRYIFGNFDGGYSLGFMQGKNYEIDFILYDDRSAYLFECKMSKNDDFTLSENASIIKDFLPNFLGDREVCGRYVIYQGKEKCENRNSYDIIYSNNWDVFSEDFEKKVEVLKEPDVQERE